MAGSSEIELSTKTQNLMQGLFSGEGVGAVFVSAYGNIQAINLEAGEERIIDNSHLVAWPDYMEYEIIKASSGWGYPGEMLVCRFRGPGAVLIQTRNPKGFWEWISQSLPVKK